MQKRGKPTEVQHRTSVPNSDCGHRDDKLVCFVAHLGYLYARPGKKPPFHYFDGFADLAVREHPTDFVHVQLRALGHADLDVKLHVVVAAGDDLPDAGN